MPDDDRKRRRLGDETKGRIADLASGWDTPGASGANAPRRKPQKTSPPAQPGFDARRQQMEDALVDLTEDLEGSAGDAGVDIDIDVVDDDDDDHDDSGGWELPTTTTAKTRRSGAVARRLSSSRSGPTETGTVDVSGIIPEKTQPPELIVPVPTVDTSALAAAPAPPRATPPRTTPPPPPGARATGAATVVPTPRAATPSGATPSPAAPPRGTPPRATPPTGARAPRAKFVIDDSSVAAPPEAAPARAASPRGVPIGEFDTPAAEAPRAEPSRAEPSRAELSRAETEEPAGRGDPTRIEPSAHRGERDDPTSGSDPTDVRAPGRGAATPKARLRTIAQLHRRSGLGGDLRYVLTAIFGLRRARRELAELEAGQATRQLSRRRHLVTLGRTAVSSDGFDHPSLVHAREQLAAVEEERARHTGQVVAADGELQRVTRDRQGKAKQHAAELEAIDAELVELGKQLEPLAKEIAGVTRRAADLRDAMRRIDEKIAFTEARLSAVNTEKDDRAAIQAEIASLKADRKSLQQDEPALASALDSLHPRIAKLEAARADARQRRLDLDQAERDDQGRTDELLAAIGAKRKVVDRAASDAEARRDKILFELGELLYVDRPESMSPEMSPIDAIDVELGTGDRRAMELREILQSVDRMKIARGVALWILLLAVVGGIAALVLGAPLPL